jgi:Domain of unknown function (DUF4405)
VSKITIINFILNMLLFLVMAAIGGVGLLMKYKLVSGEERWDIYGSNPDLYMLGWDRHQWGDIHLILGYIFFCLLFLHIVLHWSQVKGIYQRMIEARSWQIILVSAFVIVSLFLMFFAFISPIDVVPLKEGEGRHRLEAARHLDAESVAVPESGAEVPGHAETGEDLDRDASSDVDVSTVSAGRSQEPLHEDHSIHEERSFEIFGTSTIAEVAARYDVPAELIKKAIGVPYDIPDNQRLGRLRRQYGFHMSDVERFIDEYRQENKY